jgi:ribosomal protein S18 acetylase RimI-like enzyme
MNNETEPLRMEITRRPFTRESVNDILKFAGLHGLPPHRTQAQMRRYLTQMISSPNHVIDLFNRDRRVATGVVLDLVRNPGMTTPFELLGMSRDEFDQPSVLYSTMLGFAEDLLTKKSNGLTLFHHFMHPFDDTLLKQRSYEEYLNTYWMAAVRPQARGLKLPDGTKFEMLQPAKFEAYYDVVCKTFAKSPDIAVPDKETLKIDTLAKAIAPFVFVAKDRILGFVTFSIDETQRTIGEITSFGVPPQHRSQGYGRLVLDSAIQALLLQGATRLTMGVSAPNTDALKIYHTAGFQVVDRFAGFILRPSATK